MTTTCLHPTPCIPQAAPRVRVHLPPFSLWHGLAQLGAWFSGAILAWRTRQRDAKAVARLTTHQLQDIGAPHWLQQRAAAREAVYTYERFKAMSRIRY
jgi:uncharacterized protein YjiS (DUF1127 family)